MAAKLVKLKDGYNLLIEQPLGRLLEATCSISEIKRLEENNISTKKLSLKNCQAIENGYDLDEIRKLADENFECELGDGPTTNESINSMIKKSNADGAEWGFQKALEILGDKKYGEEGLFKFIKFRDEYFSQQHLSLEEFIISDKELFDNYHSLKQTEWDVEIVFDRDCYSSNGRCDKSEMADCFLCTPVTYLKDADGCLILKRI